MNINPFKLIIFGFIGLIIIIGLAYWAGVLTMNILNDEEDAFENVIE